MTLKEYIEFLINGENIDFSDSALWERLKFKIRSSTIIGGDEYLSALAMVRDSWQKSKNIIVLAEWNSLGPAFQKDSESMVDFNEVLNFWNETDDLQEKGRAAEVLLPRTTSVAEYMQLAVELLQELNRSDDKDYKKAIPRFATWFLGHLDDFMKLGPTEDQMHKLGRLFHRIDIHIKLRERFLPNAESAQNFVEIMDHHLRYPSDQFLTQLGELFLRNIDHFVSLNPSADQVREIMKFIRKRDVHIAIRERLLPKTKNVQAFLDLMDHRLTRPTHQFLTELGELFLRNMDHFVSLKPSADQACEITKIIRRRDVHISIRARLLPKTKNVQEFLDLMDHCLKRPTDEFLNEMRELFLRNVDHFVSLKPSADQVRQITKMFEMIDVHIAIRGRLLPKTKNVQEFLKLMDHGVIDPTDQFLSEMQELFLRNVDHFMSLKPSANQVRQITKMLGTIDVFIATADKILPQVKKAREFANYLDHQAIPYRRELMALMSLDKMLSKMTGIPAYPPERFGGINTISETQESLFEKMSDLFLRHLEHFVSLHPTDEDIRNVAEVLQWTEQQLRERMAYSVKQIPKPSSYGNYSCSEILLGGP